MRSTFLSKEIPAVISSVSITIPKNVILIEGPSILEDFTGALMIVQRDNIDCRLSVHFVEPGEPAVKKSSRYC